VPVRIALRAEVAQLVEHATENCGVASSILALGTKEHPGGVLLDFSVLCEGLRSESLPYFICSWRYLLRSLSIGCQSPLSDR
jgi:hypothetical protein